MLTRIPEEPAVSALFSRLDIFVDIFKKTDPVGFFLDRLERDQHEIQLLDMLDQGHPVASGIQPMKFDQIGILI